MTLGRELLCGSFDWINKLSEATHVCYGCLSYVFVISWLFTSVCLAYL